MDENITFIDYKNEKEKERKSIKEILNDILKKRLEHKLNKLEKKHVEESKSLKIMSKISKNIIISLDLYSHKVRKEIYKLRHKNDENHTIKKYRQNNKKNYDLNVNKDDKNTGTNNNIESSINKDDKFNKSVINISNHFKQKRASNSIDPKKEKSFFGEIYINKKEKSGKKEKMDVFERLASKSIGNFKKYRLEINEVLNKNKNNLLNSSKSKMKKKCASTRNLHNIINNKNESIKKSEHSPSNKNLGISYEAKTPKVNSKLISTPKLKPKIFKKMGQIKNDEKKGQESTKKRLKKASSKVKFTHRLSKTLAGIKNDESSNMNRNKTLDKKKSKNVISAETHKENKESKEQDLLKKYSILSKSINNNEISLPSNKEINNKIEDNLLIDDELIKTENKDDLLISEIREDEKINEIHEISALNLDDLNFNNSININIDLENKSLLKKPSVDINNNNTNSINNNSSLNNFKSISSNIKNSHTISNSNISNNINKTQNNNVNESNNMSKSSNNINNIIITNLNNNPINYLDNDNEINFTLFEDSHLNENDNDLNKTIDLNISGLSDHLSLQEKLESQLDEISRYLDTNDLCNLMLVNKECFTNIMNIFISKTEITIDILEEEINKIKESNKDIDFAKIKIQPFNFSSNSARAISLLDNTSDCNLIKFQNNEIINKEIFIVFGIFFIAAGKKKEYLRIENEEEKKNYISNYFKNDIEKMSLGSLIHKEINGKIFDEEIITSLYKYSCKYINIISPNRFQKANKDVAIFVFVIKNILEHIGILDPQNMKPDKQYILYNARLKINKNILEKLNRFFDQIN